jgi:DNA polymerase III alpha subunit
MDKKDEFLSLCGKALQERGWRNDAAIRTRLKQELTEIDNQNEHEYFLELVQNKVKFPKNENNLLVVHLLGLAEDFDIEKSPTIVQGEYPDIDVDYLPMVQEYLKNTWAPQKFGADKVCNIGNYTTFGIKSSLIDMTRVHGQSRDEVLSLTTKIGLKDDDGKSLTWEKCLEIHPELAEFCQRFPDIADASKRLLNRNRGRGKHAGGLVISNINIDSLVPLFVDSDGYNVSAWVQGLHDQDLEAVGFIKFDLLVITDLLRIAYAVDLIKKRHGLDSFMALPDLPDWSDESYQDDPAALAMANSGRMKGIFQFDSPGIRELVRAGGVNSFKDLVAYNAMYRPGPLGVSTDLYIERKRGRQEYTLHPILEPILRSTHGVMCYQEQVMKILNQVGKIPLKDCEAVRKAISKKKEKIIARYEPMFLENGQQTLGVSKEEIQKLWADVMKFSGYGFNKSHSVAYAVIASQLLYLKTHYPLEFFAATLYYESKDKKIKEYKQEADRMNVKINKVELNKSKVNFDIIDEQIYMGFSNIKGVGTEIAERIVKEQDYKSFEDFLDRFGTEANVVKPLVALKVFADANPLVLYEFYEHFKKIIKGRDDRDKRRLVANAKAYEEVERLIMDDIGVKIDGEKLSKAYISGNEMNLPSVSGKTLKNLQKLLNRLKSSVEGHIKKSSEDELVSMSDFKPKGNIEDDKMVALLKDIPQAAELQYYGFGWTHFIEKSPDYDGDKNISQFDEDEDLLVSYVEVQVVEKPVERKSKKGAIYYTVKIEDSSWNLVTLTVWGEDFARFKEELEYWESDSRKGNLLKIMVRRPQNGFGGYTFESPPRWERWKYIPKNKEDDLRIVVMRRPENE